MITRILASWYLLGQDKAYPNATFETWDENGAFDGTGGPDVQGDHKNIARVVARDGIVLLKNDNSTLPLKKPTSLAIIGQDAVVNPAGPNSCPDRNCSVGTVAMGWGSGELRAIIDSFSRPSALTLDRNCRISLPGWPTGCDQATGSGRRHYHHGRYERYAERCDLGCQERLHGHGLH